MILLIRFVLVSMIIYLLIRIFSRYNESMKEPGQEPGNNKMNSPEKKKISKETGEFIDYEEVD